MIYCKGKILVWTINFHYVKLIIESVVDMKKILSLIMIGVLSLCFISSVNAKIYDIETIASLYGQLAQESGIGVNAKYDANSQKLLVYSTEDETTPIFTYNYDGKSISYIDNDSVVSDTDERFTADILSILNISLAIQSTFTAMGYDDVIMDYDEEIFNNYDKYGILFKTEEYEFTYGDDTSSGSISGAIIREFKLSLDSDKIDQLVNDFSLPKLTFVPSIKAKNIAENSITFTINSNHDDSSQNNKLKYMVYRSENETYGFEEIAKKNYVYGSTTEVTDTNLEPGKTYYYKVVFLNSETPSEIIKVATSGNNNTGNENNNENEKQNENENTNTNNNEKEETGKKNPNTGAFYPATAIILLFAGIVIKNISNKKSLFKRL